MEEWGVPNYCSLSLTLFPPDNVHIEPASISPSFLFWVGSNIDTNVLRFVDIHQLGPFCYMQNICRKDLWNEDVPNYCSLGIQQLRPYCYMWSVFSNDFWNDVVPNYSFLSRKTLTFSPPIQCRYHRYSMVGIEPASINPSILFWVRWNIDSQVLRFLGIRQLWSYCYIRNVFRKDFWMC